MLVLLGHRRDGGAEATHLVATVAQAHALAEKMLASEPDAWKYFSIQGRNLFFMSPRSLIASLHPDEFVYRIKP